MTDSSAVGQLISDRRSGPLKTRPLKPLSGNFRLFKAWVLYFLKYFELRAAWSVVFECLSQGENSDITNGVMSSSTASVSFNAVGRSCVFQFNRDFDYTSLFGTDVSEISKEMVRYEIAQTAFHEVAELMLAGFYYGFRKDPAERNVVTYDADADDSQRHYVIRTLENTVFKEKYDQLIGRLSVTDVIPDGLVGLMYCDDVSICDKILDRDEDSDGSGCDSTAFVDYISKERKTDGSNS